MLDFSAGPKHHSLAFCAAQGEEKIAFQTKIYIYFGPDIAGKKRETQPSPIPHRGSKLPSESVFGLR